MTQTIKQQGSLTGDEYISWWTLYGAVMVFNTINFFIAKFKDDLSIVDITWGLMFTIPNGILLWNRWETKTEPMLLMMGLVTCWALRLSIHIGLRHKGEDWRYKHILKARWAGRPWAIQILCSYVYIFGLQGLFSMVNNASAIYVMRYSPPGAKIGTFEIAGAIVWLMGQLMEIIGDKQLQAFRDDETNRGKVIDTGFWRYTRHPNYMGELTSWWGIYLIACGAPDGYWTFWSALFISLLLRYVSGVRMLELKQRLKPAYRIYMMETSALIPMWYTKVPEEDRSGLLEKFKKEIDEEIALGKNPATKDVASIQPAKSSDDFAKVK